MDIRIRNIANKVDSIIKNDQRMSRLEINLRSILDIFRIYLEYDEDSNFLEYTHNFNRNSKNILEYLIEFYENVLERKQYQLFVPPTKLIVPPDFEVTSFRYNKRYLEFVKPTLCTHFDKSFSEILQNENVYNIFSKNLIINDPALDNFTINNLKIMDISSGMIGIGYTMYGGDRKIIKICVNDSIHSIRRILDPSIDLFGCDLAIIGKNHYYISMGDNLCGLMMAYKTDTPPTFFDYEGTLKPEEKLYICLAGLLEKSLSENRSKYVLRYINDAIKEYNLTDLLGNLKICS